MTPSNVLSRRNAIQRLALGGASAFALVSGASAEAAECAYDEPWAPRVGAPLRLDLTRNPHGPSSKLREVLRRNLSSVGEYSDEQAVELRTRLASYHSVPIEQIVLGCGASEILRMATRAFTGPEKKVILASPTCDLLGEYTAQTGARLVPVRLTSDYSHDLTAMAELARQSGTGMVYICSPNSPTGTFTVRVEMERFLSARPSRVPVVIDETHHQYVESSPETVSFLERPVAQEGVIVVRSFSKIYGLAGLRVGYAVGGPQTVARLSASRLERNISGLAAAAATASLEDKEHLEQSRARNADERQEFVNQVHARMLRVIDSQAGFVLLDTQRPATHVLEHFRQHDILLAGPFTALPRHVRVTLGTPVAMTEFWRVWDLLPRLASHGM